MNDGGDGAFDCALTLSATCQSITAKRMCVFWLSLADRRLGLVFVFQFFTSSASLHAGMMKRQPAAHSASFNHDKINEWC